MPAIAIDESRWPLVLVTFVGVSTDAEFEEYLRRMGEMINRRQTTLSILDARRAAGTPAKQRKRQAEWMKENDAVLRKYSAGTAFVIDSALVRGVLTAILWIQPMPQEHVVVATMEEAERWAQDRLAARGVRVPPRAA